MNQLGISLQRRSSTVPGQVPLVRQEASHDLHRPVERRDLFSQNRKETLLISDFKKNPLEFLRPLKYDNLMEKAQKYILRMENLYEICVAVITQLIINYPTQLLRLLLDLKKLFGSQWDTLDEDKWQVLVERAKKIIRERIEEDEP